MKMGNRMQCVLVCVSTFVIVFIASFSYYHSKYSQGLHQIAGSMELVFNPLNKYVEYVDSNQSTCPDLPIPDDSLYKNLWQPVSNSGHLFLYSAYIVDDEIRLIAIRRKTVVPVLTCQIWCRNTSSNTVFVHAARLERISGHDNNSFCTTYVVCPLSCSGSPYAVSIAEGKLTCRKAQNSFVLQKYRKVKQGNFSVCVPPVHGIYPTPFHLVQWIETNRLLGVQFFTFYNASINPNSILWKVFEKYAKEQIIELLQWNITTKDIFYAGQIASMHDCLYRNAMRFRYTGFIDLDELIIPRNPEDMTWSDMLKRLPDGCSYSFQNSFFKGNYTKVSSNELKRDFVFNNSFVVRSIKRQKKIFEHSHRSKVIVKPEEIKKFSVHITYSCRSGKVIRKVDPAIGLLHHYRFNTEHTDVNDITTLKYMAVLRKQLEKSLII